RQEMYTRARELREKYDGDIYGMDENGGTSTLYVSPVSFEKIDQALANKAQEGKRKKIVRMNKPENMLDKQKGWAYLTMISPLIGIAAAIGLSWKTEKEDE
ncbi:MAG TPA: hypothetical protein VJ969_12650, partial [Desulfopila sp.]|nr:hypothetical protein [Desulfopila sp.]